MSTINQLPNNYFKNSFIPNLPSLGIFKKIKPALLAYLLIPRVTATGSQALTTPKENIRSLLDEVCLIHERKEIPIKKPATVNVHKQSLSSDMSNVAKRIDDSMLRMMKSELGRNLDILNRVKSGVEKNKKRLNNSVESLKVSAYLERNSNRKNFLNEIIEYPTNECKLKFAKEDYSVSALSGRLAEISSENDELVMQRKVLSCEDLLLEKILFVLSQSSMKLRFFNKFIENDNISNTQKKNCKATMLQEINQQNPQKELLVFLNDFEKALQESIDCLQKKESPSEVLRVSSNIVMCLLILCTLSLISSLVLSIVREIRALNLNVQNPISNGWRSRPEKLPFGEISHNEFISFLKRSRPIIESINKVISEKIDSSESVESKAEWEGIEKDFTNFPLYSVMLYAMKLVLLDSENKPIVKDKVEQYQPYDLPFLLDSQNKPSEVVRPIHQFTDYANQFKNYSDLQPLPERSLPALIKKLFPEKDFSNGLKELVPNATDEQIHAVRVLCGLENTH